MVKLGPKKMIVPVYADAARRHAQRITLIQIGASRRHIVVSNGEIA
ncbi:hypothetical protein [Methyloversatilis sp. MC4-4]